MSSTCDDHWHCSDSARSHDCPGGDREQPCPTCGEEPTCPECGGDGYTIETVHDGRGGDADREVRCSRCGGVAFDDEALEDRATDRLPDSDTTGLPDAWK